MKLHDQIRIARERIGWDQDQFAAKMDVSKTTIQNWETGKGAPAFTRLPKLEKVLGQTLYPSGNLQQTESVYQQMRPEDLQNALLLSRMPKDIYDAFVKAMTYINTYTIAGLEQPLVVTKHRKSTKPAAEVHVVKQRDENAKDRREGDAGKRGVAASRRNKPSE